MVFEKTPVYDGGSSFIDVSNVSEMSCVNGAVKLMFQHHSSVNGLVESAHRHYSEADS